MENENKPYDVFISYRWIDPDQQWVRNNLAPALRKSGLNVCLDVEDFVPGRDLILEMNRAGVESRKVVCILTPEYLTAGRLAGFESMMARRLDPSGNESRLIPLILRKTDLPEWLRGLVATDWTNAQNHQREWRKLLRSLGAKDLTSAPPSPIDQTQPLRLAPESQSIRPTQTTWHFGRRNTPAAWVLFLSLIALLTAAVLIYNYSGYYFGDEPWGQPWQTGADWGYINWTEGKLVIKGRGVTTKRPPSG